MAKEARKSRGRSLGVTQIARVPSRGHDRASLTLRVDLGAYGALGPGKIKLLECIDHEGSISAAGRVMGMSYRRAWLLVDNINSMFAAPAVETQHGGAKGGRAVLTKFGRKIVTEYREMEDEAQAAVGSRLRAIQKALADTPPLSEPDADEP
jgi:molybdate transport system regulatory protein